MLLTSSIENQKFYLDENFISGIQSFSLSYDTNINPSFAISDTGLNYFISQPIITNFNLNYIPGDQEPFSSYTGLSFFTGKLEYSNKYLYFSSGYIENYNISAQLDRPVEVSVQGKIYGMLAYNTGLDTTSGSLNYSISPINYCYLDLNLNEVNLDRLNSCTVNYSSRKIPKYNIGEFLPFQVVQEYPIEINNNINFEISEDMINNPTGLFANLQQKDIQISFKNINNNSIIKNFTIKNAILSNKDYNFVLNDNASYSLSYKGYINN